MWNLLIFFLLSKDDDINIEDLIERSQWIDAGNPQVSYFIMMLSINYLDSIPDMIPHIKFSYFC